MQVLLDKLFYKVNVNFKSSIIRILILLVFSLLIFNCRKSGMGYVEGYVLDELTGNPISAQVDLEAEYRGEKWSYGEKGTSTNANGYFKIKYFNSYLRKHKYFVFVSPNQAFFPLKKEIVNKKEKIKILLKPIP